MFNRGKYTVEKQNIEPDPSSINQLAITWHVPLQIWMPLAKLEKDCAFSHMGNRQRLAKGPVVSE